MRVLVFSNLYPTSTAPEHGCFVQERLVRLRARMGFDCRVIHPVPLYPPLPGASLAARMSRLPAAESVGGVGVSYPRYVHVPRLGVGRQSLRLERGVRSCFRAEVEDFQPDLVDAHYLYPDGCAAVRLAREAGLPCLVTARGSDAATLPAEPAVRAQLAATLPQATRLLAVSSDLGRKVAAMAGLPAEAVLVVPNGVDVDRFRPGSGPGERRLVTVAQLIPRKRIDLLIEALADPAGRDLPQAVVVGDGPERRRLEALARARGVAGRIEFRGALGRDAVAAELARGGVFAFPTRLEGCPNAVLEALASGLPVVATEVNGIPDIFGGADVGSLVPAGAGPADWARALAATLARYDRDGRRLAGCARGRAEELSWDRTVDLLQGVFEAVGR